MVDSNALNRGRNWLFTIFLFIGLIVIFFVFSFFKTGTGAKSSLNMGHENYNIFSYPLPETLDFAGEHVPLNDLDIRERLDRELVVNSFFHSQTIFFLKRAARFLPIIEPILNEYGIPDDFKFLAFAESGLMLVVSPAGAAGYWQFKDKTAREYGLEVTDEVDERYHIEKSTHAACKYLLDSYELYGNWTLAAASYNMGRTGLNRQIKRQKVDNYYDLLLNEETSRFVFRILAIKLILSDPENYGFLLDEDGLYPPVPTYEIEVDTSIENLVDFALDQGINYKILKIFNPWLRDIKLTNRRNKVYQIRLPAEGYYDHPASLKSDPALLPETED